ncbi:uncharacterized protein LOC112890364 [Panicum hallii]|jgi:CCR4-NOT transcription complex subunit 7/8|uniref:uncharacterized protein LOC112890364 n=1 Tax=Panicum hallii TaxID=206008 RepID=UPI000DF4D7C6|nr:uncharacterized protein LOC112890364 [Panicum hallii]
MFKFNPAAQWPGAMQPPPFQHAVPAGVPLAPQSGIPVRTVWAANLDAETAALRAFAAHYPGVVHAAPPQADHNALTKEQRYAAIRANADRAADPHAPGSLEYLEARGMDLNAHRAHGIPAVRLTCALHGCGLLRRPGLSWVAYA